MNERAGAAMLTVRLLQLAFALAGPVIALAPLGMAPLVIATAIFAGGAERLRSGSWPRPPRSALILSALFLAWCTLSLAWDIAPEAGARKLVDMVLVFAAGLVLLGLADRLNPAQQRLAARALVLGAVAGLVLLGIETACDFPLYRAVMGGSNPKLADLLLSKRSVDAAPLLVWPGALALARLGRPRLGGILALVFTAASFRLTASTATLAMVTGVAVLLLCLWSVAAARRATGVAILLAFALIIPAAIAIYDAGGTRVSWLKFSAHHRFEIWHFAAEKSLDRPFFGHGLDASRFVPNDGAVSAFQAAGKPIMPLHPHDAFLQIWVELGLVGVALAGALVIAALGATARWPCPTARFAIPAFAAAIVIAGLAFGIWQTWWMATLAFGAGACNAVGRPPLDA
jgi:O-antigen ligase